MPTPARTSLEAIVSAGREALAAGGLDALTMQHVATAVGVRAPSLYKRVRDRSDLIRLVVEDLLRDLTNTLDAAASTGDPTLDLRALARAFRTFARLQPNGFGLLFSPLPEASAPDPELVVLGSAPVLRSVEALVGAEQALPAARTVTAWATGFVRMELAGAFQLGGDVDAAFEYGIEHLVIALGSREDTAPEHADSAPAP